MAGEVSESSGLGVMIHVWGSFFALSVAVSVDLVWLFDLFL